MNNRPKCFPKPLLLEFLGYNKFRLTHDFEYIAKDGTVYKTYTDSITDGRSIPKLVKSIIGGNWAGVWGWISAIHDELCKSKIVSRLKADRVFLEGAKVSGINSFKAHVAYRFLRAFAIILRKK